MRLRPDYLAVAFCTNCGSNRVDVNNWHRPGVAVINCCHCGTRNFVRGITLGRVQRRTTATTEALAEAYMDAPLSGGNLCDVHTPRSA